MKRLVPLVLLACGGPPPEPDSYVPFASHFASYTQWPSFTLPGAPELELSHLAGDRAVYIKAMPPRGATRFPVGTLIVKTASDRIFAMAKRGGNYNADGAVNWEWLELEGSVEQPFIRWRGIGPPDGEGYGPPGTSACNTCHAGAAQTDFVHSADRLLLR